MFKKMILATAIAFTSISSVSHAQQLTDSGWWIDAVGDTDNNDHAVIIFKAIDNNGRLAICGSIFNRGIPSRLFQRAMGNYLISADTTPLMRDINSFGRANSEQTLAESFTCIDTQEQWFAGANARLNSRLTKRRY